jgi:hypothetical protein
MLTGISVSVIAIILTEMPITVSEIATKETKMAVSLTETPITVTKISVPFAQLR